MIYMLKIGMSKFQNKNMTKTDLFILSIIEQNYNKSKPTFLNYKFVNEYLNISRRTYERSIKKLRDMNLIETKREYNGLKATLKTKPLTDNDSYLIMQFLNQIK